MTVTDDAIPEGGAAQPSPEEQEWERLRAQRQGIDAPATATKAAEPAPDGTDAAGQDETAEAGDPDTRDQGDRLPPDVQARLKELEAKAAEAEELRKRVAGQDRKIRELVQKEKQGGGAQGATPQPERPKRHEALKPLADEYPEFGKPLVETFSALENDFRQEVEGLKQTTAALLQQQQERAFEDNRARLIAKHPDFEQIASGLYEWVQAQPRMYRDAFDRNAANIVDIEEADALLQRYKADKGLVATPTQTVAATTNSNLPGKRERQLEGAVASRARPNPPVTTGNFADPEQEWEFLRKVRQQQRQQQGR